MISPADSASCSACREQFPAHLASVGCGGSPVCPECADAEACAAATLYGVGQDDELDADARHLIDEAWDLSDEA